MRSTVMTIDVLSGRDSPAAGTVRQHAVARRPADARHQSDVSLRRGLPAFLPGDRRVRLAGRRPRVPWCATFMKRSGDASSGPARARCPRTGTGTLVAHGAASGWCESDRRRRGFDGRLAGGVAAVAFRFHLVSPIGILLNIPLIPITSAAMLLGGLALVLSRRGARWGVQLAWAAAWLLKLTQTIVLWGVAQPLGHRFVVGPTWGWVLVFYALLALAALAVTNDRAGSRPQPDRAIPALRRLVAPGGLDHTWLVVRRLCDARGQPGGRIPGGRAWPGGCAPQLPDGQTLALRLRPPR